MNKDFVVGNSVTLTLEDFLKKYPYPDSSDTNQLKEINLSNFKITTTEITTISVVPPLPKLYPLNNKKNKKRKDKTLKYK